MQHDGIKYQISEPYKWKEVAISTRIKPLSMPKFSKRYSRAKRKQLRANWLTNTKDGQDYSLRCYLQDCIKKIESLMSRFYVSDIMRGLSE